jgi:hypothetical protein
MNGTCVECGREFDLLSEIDMDELANGHDCESVETDGYEMSDVEADADTLASAGWGTDEDYGG